MTTWPPDTPYPPPLPLDPPQIDQDLWKAMISQWLQKQPDPAEFECAVVCVTFETLTITDVSWIPDTPILLTWGRSGTTDQFQLYWPGGEHPIVQQVIPLDQKISVRVVSGGFTSGPGFKNPVLFGLPFDIQLSVQALPEMGGVLDCDLRVRSHEPPSWDIDKSFKLSVDCGFTTITLDYSVECQQERYQWFSYRKFVRQFALLDRAEAKRLKPDELAKLTTTAAERARLSGYDVVLDPETTRVGVRLK